MSETDNDEFYDAEESDDKDDKFIYKFRSQLPKPMPSKANFSVWTFLKQCIGKELSKIAMPIVFNEPISFLQRITEYMEYSSLIHEALEHDNPVDRLEKVSAFAVSVMASNWDRIGKPFNPLLGETYELITDNFKWMSEQVSHHPPISAFHCESPNKFKFYGSIHPKLKFWGKSVEITPKGFVTLELLPWNEVYTWQNVTCTVHNVIIGKIWIEHSGQMRIQRHIISEKPGNDISTSSLQCEINCHSVGWFGRNMHRVNGEIYNSNGSSNSSVYNNNGNSNSSSSSKNRQVERKLYGKWTEAMYAVDPQSWNDDRVSNYSNNSDANNRLNQNDEIDVDDPLPQDSSPCDLGLKNQRLIWRADPRPPNSNFYYNFTQFATGLNQLTSEMAGFLAPTDSRLRKDMRLMEQGFIEEASEAKLELEEKQRSKRNKTPSPAKSNFSKTSSKCEVTGPIWFHETRNPFTNKTQWLYKGGYWDRDWHRCPDIF